MVNLRRPMIQKGFTIIELMIVVIIIGILVTISTVAYNGIQGSARDSSVLSDLDALDGIQTQYGIKNSTGGKAWFSGSGSDSDINFTPSSGNIIDVVINSTDYCIRAYNPSSTSYKTLATAAIKESSDGICTTLAPSYLASGITPITNLVVNPSAETNSTGWGSYNGTGWSTSITRPSGSTFAFGSTYMRMSVTAVGTGTGLQHTFSNIPVSVGETYTASAYGRLTWTNSRTAISIGWYDGGGANLSYTSGTTQSGITTGFWTRFFVTGTAPVNAVTARIIVQGISTGGGSLPGVGATWDVDGLMFTASSTLSDYADGTSSGWVWNGTAHASTSTGFPL